MASNSQTLARVLLVPVKQGWVSVLFADGHPVGVQETVALLAAGQDCGD